LGTLHRFYLRIVACKFTVQVGSDCLNIVCAGEYLGQFYGSKGLSSKSEYCVFQLYHNDQSAAVCSIQSWICIDFLEGASIKDVPANKKDIFPTPFLVPFCRPPPSKTTTHISKKHLFNVIHKSLLVLLTSKSYISI